MGEGDAAGPVGTFCCSYVAASLASIAACFLLLDCLRVGRAPRSSCNFSPPFHLPHRFLCEWSPPMGGWRRL